MRYPIQIINPSICPHCGATLVATILRPLGRDGTLNLYNPENGTEDIYLHCLPCNIIYKGYEFKFGEDTYYTLDVESTKANIKEKLEKCCVLKAKRVNPLYREE